MSIVEKELESRKSEIHLALEVLFKANMKITDWDVAEADDDEAATILINIFQEKLDSIREDVKSGQYTNY